MFQPLKDHILIRVKNISVSSGGIALPDGTKEDSRGEILRCGPDAENLVKESIGKTLVCLPGAAVHFPGMADDEMLVKSVDAVGIV